MKNIYKISRVFLIINLSLLLVFAQAQLNFLPSNNVGIINSKVFGGIGNEKIMKVIPTNDGGYLIVGNTDSNLFNFKSYGKVDAFVVKLNKNLDTVWAKLYGGTSNDNATTAYQTAGGDFIIMGNSSSYDLLSNSNFIGRDYWIFKISQKDGKLLWSKKYGGNKDESIICYAPTKKGDLMIAGITNSSSNDLLGLKYDTILPSTWVIKIDTNGNLIQNVSLGKPFSMVLGSLKIVNAITQTSDGKFVIAGNDINLQNFLTNIWLSKFDEFDTIHFDKTFYGNKNDAAFSIIENSNKELVVIGSTESDTSFFNHTKFKTTAESDIFVLKFDALCNKVLSKKFLGGSNNDSAVSIVQLKDKYFLLGSTNSNDFDIANKIGISTGIDYSLFVLDSGLNYINQKTIGGSNIDIPKEMILTKDNALLIIGQTKSTDKFLAGKSIKGGFDAWIFNIASIADFKTNATNNKLCPGDTISIINKSLFSDVVSCTYNGKYVPLTNNISKFIADTVKNGIILLYTKNNNYNVTDTLKIPHISLPKPLINLKDTAVCFNSPIKLNPNIGGILKNSYKWSTNSTLDILNFNVKKSERIYVTITDRINNCSNTDSVFIKANPIPIINLGQDVKKCMGDVHTIKLDTLKGKTIKWMKNMWIKNDTILSIINITKTDSFRVVVTDSITKCWSTDAIFVKFNLLPIRIYNNRKFNICQGDSIKLISDKFADSVIWSNNKISDSIFVNKTGKYFVKIFKENCINTDTAIAVVHQLPQIIKDSIAPIKCFGEYGGIFINRKNVISDTTFKVLLFDFKQRLLRDSSKLRAGTHFVRIINNHGCKIDKSYYIVEPKELKINVSSVFDENTCGNQDGKIVFDIIGGTKPYNYKWSNGDISKDTISKLKPGLYTLTVKDSLGCGSIANAFVGKALCPVNAKPGLVSAKICQKNDEILLNPIYFTEDKPTSDGFKKDSNKDSIVLKISSNKFKFKKNSGKLNYGNGKKDIKFASLTIRDNQIALYYDKNDSNKYQDSIIISEIRIIPSSSNYSTNEMVDSIIFGKNPTNLLNGIDIKTNFGLLIKSDTMTLKSVELVPTDSAIVAKGSLNNKIIGINIKTKGTCTPLSIESFEFDTYGSENPDKNIVEVRVYYTAKMQAFAPINLFGSFIDSPDEHFKIIAATSKKLKEGDNYFWLTYDVASNAVNNDKLNGKCIAVTINGIRYNYNIIDTNVANFPKKILPTVKYIGSNSGDWDDPKTWGNSKSILAGEFPGPCDDATINSGVVVNLTADAACNNLTLSNGQININSYQFTINGNLGGAQFNNIMSTSSSMLVIGAGCAPAPGRFTFPSGILKLKKLTINRASGAQALQSIDLDDAVPADSNVLVLQNGVLWMLNGSKLIMNSKAIKKNIPCSNNSYVDGIVSRNVMKLSGYYYFPVGNNGICRQFGIFCQNGNTDNISEVQFYYLRPPNAEFVNYGDFPGGIFNRYYWKHTVISGANTQRKMLYDPLDFGTLSFAQRLNYLTLANNPVSSPITEWAKSTTPTEVEESPAECSVDFVNANASNEQFWTFASMSADIPLDAFTLPIELYSFTAKANSSRFIVDIDWITLSETNNDYFEIQRSNNNQDFVTISKVMGAGNSTEMLVYHTVDYDPIVGTTYYRLKQTDYNGKFSYSKSVVVKLEGGEVKVYPNPVSNKLSAYIFSLLDDEVNITLTDVNGRIIYGETRKLYKGQNQIDINVENINYELFVLKIEPTSSKENSNLPNIFKQVIIKVGNQ